jgi:fatty acid desaturase
MEKILFPDKKIITKIFDDWYDLSDFVKIHPGGILAPQLINGRDGTGLFKLHHPFTDKAVLDKYLEKYRIADPGLTLDGVVPYDWTETEFEKELKTSVKKHFLEKSPTNKRINGIQEVLYNTKCTWFRYFQLMVINMIMWYTIYMYYQHNWLFAFILPFTVWIASVNFWHDASHFAMSTNEYINLFFLYTTPFFSSPTSWLHEHIIGHHVYPNIPGKDPDLYHSPGLLRLTTDVQLKDHHKNQIWNVPLAWFGGVFIGVNFTSDFRGFVKKSYNRVVPYMQNISYFHFLGRLIYGLTMFIPVYYFGLIYGMLPHVIFSFIFMFCTQINHLTADNMQFNKNIYVHQILTSNTISPDSLFLFIFTGGLNLQTEHHLFPGINHWNLREIQPMVKSICLKHGIAYNESLSLWQSVNAYFKYVIKMGK